MITKEQLIEVKNSAEATLVFLDNLEIKLKKVDKNFDSKKYRQFRKLLNDFLNCNLSNPAIITKYNLLQDYMNVLRQSLDEVQI